MNGTAELSVVYNVLPGMAGKGCGPRELRSCRFDVTPALSKAVPEQADNGDAVGMVHKNPC